MLCIYYFFVKRKKIFGQPNISNILINMKYSRRIINCHCNLYIQIFKEPRKSAFRCNNPLMKCGVFAVLII